MLKILNSIYSERYNIFYKELQWNWKEGLEKGHDESGDLGDLYVT